jgi:predicted  nucleic acid-binding Zn-ribbon protein
MFSMRNLIFSLSLILTASLSLTSCSNKATEEQMKTLRELDSQRGRLQSELNNAKNQLADLQGKLAALDRELNDCRQQTQAVQEGLRLWPNIWPDAAEWNPPPPPPPPAPTKKGKKK